MLYNNEFFKNWQINSKPYFCTRRASMNTSLLEEQEEALVKVIERGDLKKEDVIDLFIAIEMTERVLTAIFKTELLTVNEKIEKCKGRSFKLHYAYIAIAEDKRAIDDELIEIGCMARNCHVWKEIFKTEKISKNKALSIDSPDAYEEIIRKFGLSDQELLSLGGRAKGSLSSQGVWRAIAEKAEKKYGQRICRAN